MAAKTLYLIDGHAQIYRAYYAPFGNLSSPKGEPTRAVHVFTQMLLNLLRDRKPDYLAMVLDVSDKSVFRMEIAPDYKANRQAPPEDLEPQMQRIISIVQAMQIPILRMKGFEADDILATLAGRHAAEDLHVYLVSKDKDLDQVLGDHVRLYDPGKDAVIDMDGLRKAKGWGPESAVEAQMLVGDSTDNIIGVPGVGPKKAAQLLSQYGNVANIIANAEALTPKLRENILAFKDRMDVVRRLVTLRGDVPIELELAHADVTRFQPAGAVPILTDLGLSRLIERLGAGNAPAAKVASEVLAGGVSNVHAEVNRKEGRATLATAVVDTAKTAAKSVVRRVAQSAATLFDAEDEERDTVVEVVDAVIETPSEVADTDEVSEAATPSAGLFDSVGEGNPDYKLIDTEEALRDFAAELARQSVFAFDTETTGLLLADCDPCGISISYEVGKGYYVPVRGVGRVVSEEAVRRHLGPIFSDEQIRKVGQNLKYDIGLLACMGIAVRGADFDTMIASFVTSPMRRSHGIDSLAMELLRYRKIPTSDLIGKGKDAVTFAEIPIDRTCQYAAEDADIALRLHEILDAEMCEPEIRSLFHELEMPLVQVLMRMERNGVAVDTALLKGISDEMATRLAELEDQIYREAKRPFNINSTKQLAEVLFDAMGLRVVKRTQTLRSTDAEVLAILAKETEQPILRLLLEHRELSKLKGTYVDSLPYMISKRTGRIHPSFNQIGAITGRISCNDPNLQNIPIRTETGAQIRRAFVPGSPDHVLIKADYSQIELRVLAHFSGDENLREAFLNDHDIHAFVAAQINDVPIQSVSKEQRSRAKGVNFGIVYGQSAFGLARATGMSQNDAKLFIARYFARYPRVRAFLDSCIAHARQHGYVKTMLGRRRPIMDIQSRNQSARNTAERFAVNTVVQGTAADMIKRAMVNIDRRLLAEKRLSRMLIQVHDELVFESPRSNAQEDARMIAEEMSRALALSVPIKVDVSMGANWLDMEKMNL
ncbi:MAG TPA: DNA polymerase I [Phycisphaerae bacterium]|nr:DNA polymerase I [Phycisphaerae bacterium]